MFGSGKKKKAVLLVEEAEMCLMLGNESQAIKKFRESLQLDPDNAEAWNNLGAILGGNNKHAEAKDCFEKAVRLRPNYVNAWRGLAVSEKNLKHYDRSMEICEKIEEELHGSAGDIRADIVKRQEEGIEPPQGDPFDPSTAYAKHYGGAGVEFAKVLMDMMTHAVQEGVLPAKDIKHVPELCCEAEPVVKNLISAIEENCREREGCFNPINQMELCLAFSIYAGMGAALEWDRDWPELRKKGIFKKLIEKNGIFAMDEYVVEMYTGKAFESVSGRELQEKVRKMAQCAANSALDSIREKSAKDFIQLMVANIPVVCVACYWFGVTFAMYKIARYKIRKMVHLF